jgi:hypothetical protein
MKRMKRKTVIYETIPDTNKKIVFETANGGLSLPSRDTVCRA